MQSEAPIKYAAELNDLKRKETAIPEIKPLRGLCLGRPFLKFVDQNTTFQRGREE